LEQNIQQSKRLTGNELDPLNKNSRMILPKKTNKFKKISWWNPKEI